MPYNELLDIHLTEPKKGPFFLHVTGDTAIFAIPGWWEEPSCMQPSAEKLHSLGHAVAVCSYPDFHTSKWTDWVRAIWTQLLAVRQRGIKKVILLGFSLGGLIALDLATLKDQLKLKYGLEVLGVAAVSPPLRLRWQLHLLSEAVRVSTFDREFGRQASRLIPTIHFPHSQYALEPYWRSEVDRTLISTIELIRAIRFSNQTLKQNTLQLPVLIVVSDRDELVDSKQTIRIAKKRMRQVEARRVSGVHNSLLHHACPMVCGIIHEFISQIEGN